MKRITYQGIRSGVRRDVVFDLGNDDANKLAAIKHAWDINAHIVAIDGVECAAVRAPEGGEPHAG